MKRDRDAELREEIAAHLSRRWLEHAGQDLRYALRIFRRNPSFALVAILSLALGIGANTALFEVVNAVRLQALPVSDPGTLAEVRLTDMDGARGSFQTWHRAVTYPIWQAIAARQQAFSGLFAWGGDSFNLSKGGEIRTARGVWVTGDLFPVLGVRPAAGRLFTPDDDRPGCAPRVVLSHAFWQRQYAGSPAVVGQTLALGSHATEIIGVTPASFLGLEVGKTFDVAVLACADPVFSDDGKGRLASGTDWWLTVFGRLKPGWTVERASAHLAAISPDLFQATLPARYPAVSVSKYLAFKLEAAGAASGLSQLREEYTSPLWMLLGTAALVLVIACANLANLLLARATARQKEIAVRLGMGASRGRVVRQLLTESLLLAAIGGLCASLLAGVLSRSFVALVDPGGASTALALGINWRVLAFTTGLSLLTCILFGLAPAMSATRMSASSVMRATARGATAGREAVGLRRGLVIAQVALSVVLLFGSLLFARSLRHLVTMDPGFRAEGMVTASVVFRRLDLPEDRRGPFRQQLLERVRALPGVQSAATTRIIPVTGNAWGNSVWPEGEPARQFDARFNAVSRGYFGTMGTPLVAGREFTEADTPQSVKVAIVNEAFAAGLAPQGAPVVGARFVKEPTPSTPATPYEIVGVVKNAKYADLKEGIVPVAFLSDAQDGGWAYAHLMVRTSLPPTSITAAITRTLDDIDPRIGVTYGVMSDDIRNTVVRERLLATLSGAFGVLAAVLTLVGLYGLIAYTVTRRTNEIGVRVALGAGRSAIARLILRETGLLLAVGAVFGVGLALAGGRAAATLLFGVLPYDPAALALALAALAAIAFVATYAPARRATRIEPVSALRNE